MRRGVFLLVASWPLWWVAGACTTATVAPDGGADGTTDVAPDGRGDLDGGCPLGTGFAYTAPGCDQQPVCIGPQDACTTVMCGCDGKLFWGGCGGGFADKPFQVRDACPPGDNPDATDGSDGGVLDADAGE